MTNKDTMHESGGASPKALMLSQRLIPLGRRVLPRLPERPTQLAMGEVLGRWPQLWGLGASSGRVRSSRRAFELGFPDEDVEDFLNRWVMARGRGMATCLSYMARWIRDRPSRVIRPGPDFELPTGPCVVAFLHYAIDPIAQIACISAAREDLSVRWPYYPMQPGIEDDRELLLAGNEIPARIAETLLPITDPSWVAIALDHLTDGGTVFTAIDTPFDSNRRASTSISVGRASLPLSPSIELFARVEGLQIVLAWPRPKSRTSWTLDLKPAASVEELAELASEWIEAHREHWAGWPYLVWRENASHMRENVMRIHSRSE